MFEIESIAGLTAVYLVCHACLRRCRLNTLWLLFGVVPAVLTPLWAWSNQLDCFVWLKLLSVYAGVCWAAYLRFTVAGRNSLFRSIVPWILLANVGEAMCVDLAQSELEHLMNAMAAMMLILTIPFDQARVQVRTDGDCRDLQFDLPRAWIFGYTLWNWSFVMLNYPAFAGHHLAILLAAQIVGWINPKIWLQARAATLGLNLLLYASNPNALLSVHDARGWSSDYVDLLLPSLACVWMLVAVVRSANNSGMRLRPGRSDLPTISFPVAFQNLRLPRYDYSSAR